MSVHDGNRLRQGALDTVREANGYSRTQRLALNIRRTLDVEGKVNRAFRQTILGFGALGFYACGPGSAIAADLHITVNDDEGKAVPDAVVTLAAAAGTANLAQSLGQSFQVNQKDTAYDPFVTAVPKGASVAFINSDSWGHHVYSFSAAKRFDITVPANTTSDPIVFDKPGVVVVGCNIHDRMLAYIFVNNDGIPVKSDKTGTARFLDIEQGAYVATVWHPSLRSKRKTPKFEISLGKDGVNQEVVTIDLKRKSKKKRKPRRY